MLYKTFSLSKYSSIKANSYLVGRKKYYKNLYLFIVNFSLLHDFVYFRILISIRIWLLKKLYIFLSTFLDMLKPPNGPQSPENHWAR